MELKDCKYVLVNGGERVVGICDIEEKIKEILEEDINTGIAVHPTFRIEPSISSDEIIDNFNDNGMIHDDEFIPNELIEELDLFLEKWCKKVSDETGGYFNTDFEKFINVAGIVEKVKKELEGEDDRSTQEFKS